MEPPLPPETGVLLVATRLLFPAFLLVSIVELIFEVRLSRRNSAALVRQGALNVAPRTLPIMTALYVLMYAGTWLEYLYLRMPVSLSWFAGAGAVYIAAKLLKFWAVRSLGPYWTMKVLVLPGSKTVTTGPYRWIRHPNYVAVLMEIAGTTLAGRAFWTCMTVLALFCVVLYYRIRVEEDTLAGHTDYANSMTMKRRFLP